MNLRHPPGGGAGPEGGLDSLLTGRLLKVQEVADRLGLSSRSVQSLIAARRLRVVRLSPRAIRVSEGDVNAFIQAAAGPAPTP